MEQGSGVAGLQVRALANEAERETYFQLCARIFPWQEESTAAAATCQRLITGLPAFQPEQVRGAFLDGQLVGGYMQLPRLLCIDGVEISTGCISSVCTHPDFRKRGIALALMRDALRFADSQRHNLLLLHGIPDFYHRLDFIDVCEDLPNHTMKREVIEAQPASSCTVRPATRADAPAILALYQEQQERSPVNFACSRTLAGQEHALFNWFAMDVRYAVAVNQAGQIEGYLLLARHGERVHVHEAAARNWSAALALLHYHVSLLDHEAEPVAEFTWPVPFYTDLYSMLADHLPLKSFAYARPNNGWMARPLHLARLLEICQPMLQARWQTGSMPRASVFALHIGEESWQVELTDNGSIALAPCLEPGRAALPIARLSLQAFTQALFGFRSLPYLAEQPGVEIANELFPALATLFPARPAWIALSDFF